MKKILLLHGWNPNNYSNKTDSKDAWDNRSNFVSELEKEFQVYKINFPGFCGEKEYKNAWTLEDYSKYVKKYIDKIGEVDYILGYSFGGAVAVKYAAMYNINQKLILVSPAIVRNMDKSKKFIKTPKCLNSIRNKLRIMYLKYIIKNECIVNGTKFLNDSYNNIVRISLLDEITKLDKNNITIIYGENDTMVNPNLVSNILKDFNIIFIKDGGHDIANTNTKELINIIKHIK